MEKGKHIVTSLVLAALSLTALAQGTVVTGIIQDHREVPITGARICQANTANCTAADINGLFHLLLEPGKEMNLQVECLGFKPVEVMVDQSTAFPLRVTMIPMYSPEELAIYDNSVTESKGSAMRSSLTINAVFSDFAEFTPELGSYNTDIMDYFAVIGPELGATVSRVYFGLGFGFGYSYKEDYDTLIVDLNNTLYKLNFGYDLVSTRRIRITPLLSVRWLRYRLMNYPGERQITLANYLEEKDIDLRFNQTIAVAGLNMEYLMYSESPGRSDYWSVGVEGGYAVKLNQVPWVYSKGNRILTDHRIGLNPLTFGLSLTYYTVFR